MHSLLGPINWADNTYSIQSFPLNFKKGKSFWKYGKFLSDEKWLGIKIFSKLFLSNVQLPIATISESLFFSKAFFTISRVCLERISSSPKTQTYFPFKSLILQFPDICFYRVLARYFFAYVLFCTPRLKITSQSSL